MFLPKIGDAGVKTWQDHPKEITIRINYINSLLMGPPEPLKTSNSFRKITKNRGIFRKDCLHTMVFEVLRQFFWFGPWLGILVLSQFEVFRGSMLCRRYRFWGFWWWVWWCLGTTLRLAKNLGPLPLEFTEGYRNYSKSLRLKENHAEKDKTRQKDHATKRTNFAQIVRHLCFVFRCALHKAHATTS